MTAPAPTAIQQPNGRKLGDGYPTVVTMSLIPDIALWPKTVTPAGFEGGDANDTTTMLNVRYRTKSPRALIEMTNSSYVGAYDPAVLADLEDVINVTQTITEHYPDGSSLAYYGFVKTVAKGEMTEGSQPTVTVTIVPTNQDPVTCAEEGPVFSPGSGTAPSC